MPSRGPRYSMEEFQSRADDFWEREIRALVANRSAQDFVVIDIETGDFEVDASELAASDRLYARRPNAQPWLRRVGFPYAHRFGWRGPRGQR